MAQTTPDAAHPRERRISGTFAGSGQPQLFVVNVPSAAPLSIQLTDPPARTTSSCTPASARHRRGETYDYGANGAGSSQSLLIPSAAAGTWYVLVYAESVSPAEQLHPPGEGDARAGDHRDAGAVRGERRSRRLTLTGAGFTNATSVALVAADSTTTYPASSVTFDTFTQLTATVNLAGVPQGIYSIRVTNGSRRAATLCRPPSP